MPRAAAEAVRRLATYCAAIALSGRPVAAIQMPLFELCKDPSLKRDEATGLPLQAMAQQYVDNLRVASAVVDTSVLTVTPDTSPLATAHVEFVTVIPLPLFLDHVVGCCRC